MALIAALGDRAKSPTTIVSTVLFLEGVMLVITNGKFIIKRDGGCEDGIHDSTVYYEGQIMAFTKTDDNAIKYYRDQGYTISEE